MSSPAVSAPDRRLWLLSPGATFNGVDFAETDPDRRGHLDIHFINRVRISGTLARDRPPVTLTAPGLPEVIAHPIRDGISWSTDTTGRPVLHVAADIPDVPARWMLAVRSGRIDPCFQSAVVTVAGPDGGMDGAGMDCSAPASACTTTAGPAVPIDYLAKDFASFCQALSDFSAARYPQWVERSEADFGVMLMEALSALADELSYLQDRVAAEATLDTATQRLSLVQHARLVDYEPTPPLAATAVIQVDVAEPLSGLIQCQAIGDQTVAVSFAAGTDLPGLTAATAGALAAAPASSLDPRWNRYADAAGSVAQLVPYLWDQSAWCLPRGATSMWIAGHGHGFYPGQALLIDTAGAAAGDPPLREIVRLTGATEDDDPVQAQNVTQVRWADGLSDDHDLTRTLVAGNLVPAVQGRIMTEMFAIPGGEMPAGETPLPLATVRADHSGSPVHCLYTLSGNLAWQLIPAPDGGPAQPQPAVALSTLSDGAAETWQWAPRLLDADGTARSFAITPERYSQTSLRARCRSTTTTATGRPSASETAPSADRLQPALPSARATWPAAAALATSLPTPS
jgi:hypothetical protein